MSKGKNMQVTMSTVPHSNSKVQSSKRFIDCHYDLVLMMVVYTIFSLEL